MRCLCCYKSYSDDKNNCPRCGFTKFHVVETDPDTQKGIERLIQNHRRGFLANYDVGVTSYYWKDQDGAIVLDYTSRKSFGPACELLGKSVFLEQEFARVTDVEELAIEVTIEENGGSTRSIQLRVPLLKEAELLQLGMELDQELQLRLLLKNQTSQTRSEPAALLAD